jgi:ABC-type bacteriocin/lantibiotic exporter with double-glycine peptidase domain
MSASGAIHCSWKRQRLVLLCMVWISAIWSIVITHRSLKEISYLGGDGVCRQRSSSDCGAAALWMLFDHFGISVNYEDLIGQLGVMPRGTTMLSLKQLAETRGLLCEGWRLAPDDLRHIPFPAILLVQGNHYVVLDSFTPRGDFVVRDPARGKLQISRQGLESIWGGEILLFCQKQDALSFMRQGFRSSRPLERSRQ